MLCILGVCLFVKFVQTPLPPYLHNVIYGWSPYTFDCTAVTYSQDMVWHHCIEQMAAHGKGTKLTPCTTGMPRPSKLSDPHFLPMKFPQFGHCRGVTPGMVFQPATKPPGIWKSTCSRRRVVELLINYWMTGANKEYIYNSVGDQPILYAYIT